MYFFEPWVNGEEWFPDGDIEYDYDAVAAFVVGVGDGAIAFLACGVPYLQLGRGFINLQSAESL